MEELLKLLETFHPVDPQLQLYLLHNLPKETHRAKKVILDEGQVGDWIAFVEKGLLKIYYENEDTSERIIWFHKEGDIIGSMKSYYSGQPSKLIVRAMEETHLRKIKKTELETLMQKFPGFYINALRVTELYYARSEDHVILLSMPPKERYKKLQSDYPWMLTDKRIKDYMLADYLSISKATLSRFRNGSF